MIAMLLPPVLLTLGLALGLWWWTPLHDRRPTLRLLTTLILTSALIVWLQLILGVFHALTPSALIIVTLVLIVALNGTYWLWGRRKLAHRIDPIARPTPIGIFLGVLTLLVYAWLAWVGTLIPPFGWDTMTYHLTDVLHLGRSQSVAMLPMLPGRGVQFFFPQVGEFHASWFYILSGASEGSYRVAGYGLIAMTLIAGVATRAAAEALGLRLALPWLIPGVMLTPAMMSQPLELYVDAAFAAFIIAAVALGMWADRQSRFSHLAIAALAAGLAFGVKVSFLYFSLPIAGAIASVSVWRAVSRGGWARATGRVLVLLALFTSGFGFWLGRNLINTGNPFWPTRVKVAGVTAFEGPVSIPRGPQTAWYVSSRMDWLGYPFHETHRGKTHYSGNGFGPFFAAGYVSLILTLPIALARRRWRLVRALLAIPLTILPFLLLSPTSEPRYIQAVIGFAAIALAVLFEMIGRGWRATDIESGSPIAPKPDHAPSPTPLETPNALTLAKVALTIAVVFGALGSFVTSADELDKVIPQWREGTWKPQHYYRMKYGAAGDAFNWISDNGGPDKTFTFTNSTFIAPIMGWHNRNRVVHAAVTGDPKVGPVRRISSYRGWRRFLRDEKVDYIVVWIPWWGESTGALTEEWIARYPRDFELVAEFKGRAKIFRPSLNIGPEPAEVVAGLGRLADAEAWKLEYKTGAETVVSDAGGAVRFDYTFQTPGNDYCDWRFRMYCEDWSFAPTLTFEIEAERQPAFLIFYLKNDDPSEASRFRVDLRNLTGNKGRIQLPLRGPEWRSARFDPENICEVHIVLDDTDDAALPAAGSITLKNFVLGVSKTTPKVAQ